LKNYLRALSFLTIIPLPFVSFDPDSRELSNSAVCFPLAGATIGFIVAAMAWLLLHLFLTRGLHVDGLADTADGLIGTTGREKAFEAMDDSAVGVMGAVSVFFVYLLKFTLLVSLGTYLLPFALFFMPLAGRWAIVFAGTWFGPARDRGLGDLFLSGLRWPVLLKASLLSALLLYLFACWRT
jgi:adenosylcobinamide-GDP ribazoletransferase